MSDEWAPRADTAPFAGLVRVMAGGGAQWAVYAPTTASQIIRRLPRGARHWDDEAGCWLVAVAHVEQLTMTLRQAGFRPRILVPGRPAPPVDLPNTGPIVGARWR